MSVTFRCQHCGKKLSIETPGAGSVPCPHCSKSTAIPAALASLPAPHVPPDASPSRARANAAAPARPARAGEFGQEPELLAAGEGDAVMKVMARLMPLVISIFLHLGLVLVLVFFATIVGAPKIVAGSDDIVFPDVVTSGDALAAPGTMTQRSPGQNMAGPGSPSITAGLRDSIMPAPNSRTSRGVIGVNSSAESAWRHAGIGSPTGIANARGSGMPGGDRGLFPTAGLPGGRPASHFVYVIDRSGSMIATFDVVRDEMYDSIRKLKDSQDFHVILFNQGAPMENPPRRLVSGTEDNKVALVSFLGGVAPTSSTLCAPALSRAFDVLQSADASRPGKVIHLLTDGEFEDNDRVLAVIRERNSRKDVFINTFLCSDNPGGTGKAAEVLKKIAADNGGKFTLVNSD